MKTILFAAALLIGAASVPAFAATDTAPVKHKTSHAMKKSGSPGVNPAREPSTDQLNQQQLNRLKSS